LLLSDIPIPETLKQIQDIFGMNPTQIRSWRNTPRKTLSLSESNNYLRRKKKHCF
jgi:hypothetical protein